MKLMLRFRCLERRSTSFSEVTPPMHTVVLRPVYPSPGDPAYEEVKRFFDATPNGVLELGVVKEDQARSLVIGEDYYITIESVNQALEVAPG